MVFQVMVAEEVVMFEALMLLTVRLLSPSEVVVKIWSPEVAVLPALSVLLTRKW